MALTPVQDQGLWYLNGVSKQTGVRGLLGRRPYSIGSNMPRQNTGPHFVAFDDSFSEPVIVRAYYDPMADASHNSYSYQFLGYMQFMQVNFAGFPIPPWIYGGSLADRAPYVCDAANGYHFVDFMGPEQANLRKFNNDAFDPFYPFNASLLDGTLVSKADFSRYPAADRNVRNGGILSGKPADGGLLNGSLYFPQGIGTYDDSSLCASLRAEISASLFTEATIASVISEKTYVLDVPTTRLQLAQQEAYAIALNYMSNSGDMRRLFNVDAFQPSELAGQVYGKYVLIRLPDEENYNPSLCIFVNDNNPQQPTIAVHLLSYYVMESLEETAAMSALRRIYEFFRVEEINVPLFMMNDDDMPPMMVTDVPVPKERGRGGLMSSPFNISPDRLCIELKYHTLLFAWQRYQPGRGGQPNLSYYVPINGFRWSALFQYDDDTRRIILSTIREPEFITDGFDYLTPLNQYYKAMNDPGLKNMKIDTSNFTRAAMLRDNLGAGVKLNYIKKDGSLSI